RRRTAPGRRPARRPPGDGPPRPAPLRPGTSGDRARRRRELARFRLTSRSAHARCPSRSLLSGPWTAHRAHTGQNRHTARTAYEAHRAVRRRAPYGPADTERFDTEEDKRPGRTAFQRDRARVLHSAALRRLAGKTQVVTPGTRSHQWDASPRTRLTHSLECAQVGRELGAVLGCDPDLVETACLSHDMGHPPFGHNGEQALNDFASDCGGFEGNAQSLRLLTRLEPKRFVHDPRTGDLVSVGLNLTRAALDAATKYPWPRGAHPTDPHSVKFGVYADDLPVFAWAREGAPEDRTCFEAQVMDWSDDVAYSVHDFEDGLHAGHIDPNCLYAEPERDEIWAVAIGRYVPAGTDPQELAEALDRLIDQDWWPHGYDGSAVAQARLKDATSQLIGRFCTEAET
ncbi:dGTPase, partial [Streptomyces sp. Ncost-T6T-2b]